MIFILCYCEYVVSAGTFQSETKQEDFRPKAKPDE